jgi:hypothetical protein
MVAWWKENARPLAAFFGDKPLRKISPVDIAAYQNARRDLGRAPQTINGELSVLRQLLKHASCGTGLRRSITLSRTPSRRLARRSRTKRRPTCSPPPDRRPPGCSPTSLRRSIFLRSPRLRDQGAPVEAHLVRRATPFGPPLKNAGRVAGPVPERHLPRGAVGSASTGVVARLR